MNASPNGNARAPGLLTAPEAELCVLGAMVLDGAAVRRAAELLEADDFADRRHRLLFGAILTVWGEYGAADPPMVLEHLRKIGQLEDAGGIAYLAELLDAVPTAAHLEYHARIVRERSTRRRLAEAARQLQVDAESETLDNGELLERIRAAVANFERRAGERERPRLRTLSDILADPAMLEPPPFAVPRLACPGRATLLAAREKDGKSTLAAAAAAACTRGAELLDGRCRTGLVLWFALEEHLGDVARRFVEFDADPDRIVVATDADLLPNAVVEYAARIEEVKPVLAVVDTLPAFAALLGEPPDPGDSAAWTAVMRALLAPIRDHETALLLLHHAAKSDGSYRDSTAIGANVDMILELSRGEDAGVRKIKARGRWQLDDFAVRLTGNVYELVSGALSLEQRVLAFVAANPGCSLRSLRKGVSGRNEEKDRAVEALLEAGLLEDVGDGHSGRRLRCAPAVGTGHSAQDGGAPSEKPHGHATGTGDGHGRPEACPVPPPYIGGHGHGHAGTDETELRL